MVQNKERKSRFKEQNLKAIQNQRDMRKYVNSIIFYFTLTFIGITYLICYDHYFLAHAVKGLFGRLIELSAFLAFSFELQRKNRHYQVSPRLVQRHHRLWR